MNSKVIYVVLGAIVLIAVIYFVGMGSNKMTMNDSMNQMATTTDENMMATTTGMEASSTSMQDNTGTKVTNTNGYPSSWPADVPKYPNVTVSEKAGNNPKSLPTEAGVVFTTSSSVKSVVDFYLKGLVANGWKITEDGAGTADMTTFRATKGKRTVGGYVHKETTGKTEATIGVNLGL